MKEHLYIHGAYFESNSGEFFETKNPANGKVIAKRRSGQVKMMLRELSNLQRQGFVVWSSMSAVERGQHTIKSCCYYFVKGMMSLHALEVIDSGKAFARS